MDFIYSKSLLQEFRLENLSFKYSDCNKTFEFLKYIHNESNFNNKEYCYVIAFFELNNSSEPDIRTVGSRLYELDDHEYLVFRKLMQYAYNILGDARLYEFNEFMISNNN